jgi:hypothetical protein
MPGFENIYVDHFIVDVTDVLRGTLTEHRIQVDFWGVSHLPEYNLPAHAFSPGPVVEDVPATLLSTANSEVCGKDVQETISSVGEVGRELEKVSAITVNARIYYKGIE